MKRLTGLTVLVLALATIGPRSRADIMSFDAALTGPNEFPPTPSPGTGFAEIDFDSVAHTMRVRIEFSGLTSGTTAAHIHSATSVPGTGTAGVATQVPTFSGFPLGVTSGTYDQTFNTLSDAFYNPAFEAANGGTAALAEGALLTGMSEGKAYLNIHTVNFPSGEIRGFLALRPVPEPTSLAILGLGSLAVLGYGWNRRRKAEN